MRKGKVLGLKLVGWKAEEADREGVGCLASSFSSSISMTLRDGSVISQL